MEKAKVKIRLRTLIFLSVSGVLLLGGAARAQTGGNFAVTQSVIASGGGQNSTGGTFSLDGTIGQTIAGTNSANNPFAVQSGFWTSPSLAPTAAGVSIGGRVLVGENNGLENAVVYLTDQTGEVRVTRTGSFGYYRFDDVAAGQTVIITVASRRFQFAPLVVGVNEELTNVNFFSLQQ